MKYLVITLLAVLLPFGFVAAETTATHVIICNDNTVYVGKIIEHTDSNVIFQKTDDDIVIIPNDTIKQIKNLEKDQSKDKPKDKENDSKKYIKIPIYQDYKPYTKMGWFFTEYKFAPKNFDDIYDLDNCFSIGFSMDIDYSPMAGVVLKYFSATQEWSGIDSIGWFGDKDDLYEYDVKWSQSTFYFGPRLHYQLSMLNPYADIGFLYTTVGEKGDVVKIGYHEPEESYKRGYGSFGFGYGFGLQLITPFKITIFGEVAYIKAPSGNIEIGGKYIGGGFCFNFGE